MRVHEMKMISSIFSIVLVLLYTLRSDTIADCRYEDFHGHWMIEVYNYNRDCSEDPNPGILHKSEVHFEFPNLVRNRNGQSGHWTMIDNEGAELTINERTYLLMNWYNSTHYSCQMTIGQWSYSTTGKDWFCARAYKLGVDIVYHHKKNDTEAEELFRFDRERIARINQVQKSWKSAVYPEFETYTKKQMKRVMGGRNPVRKPNPVTLKRTEKLKAPANGIPENFDWRTIKHPSGLSYVSPVRAQLHCGSCYAFASMGAAEARLRIVSNMTDTTIFSPQDIVECSAYSQGCEGGYAYLTFGKYAQDFGLVAEGCNPYKGKDNDECTTLQECKRYYFTNYGYLGGYDGATNEENMKLELIQNGPFPVAINATHDFVTYQGGIYVAPKEDELGLNDFNPFVPSNHAVLLVGYGFDEDLKMPYWIVKNSWSTNWGEEGFFRIRRGTNELAIESLAAVSSLIYF